MKKQSVLILLSIILIAATGARAYVDWIFSNSVVIPVVDYNLTLTANVTSAIINQPIGLTATLSFTNGSAIPDKTIYFLLNGTYVGFTATDNLGQASFTYTPYTTDALNFTAAYQP